MKTVLLHTLFLILVATAPAFAAAPNFIFILGDDINRDHIGCYGGVDCKTPNIDRLAEDGVRFTKAYTSVAMCAPFRQELYSGRTPWRTKSFLNHSHSIPETKSLPHYLQPLGYRVGLIGKGHIGPRSVYPFEMLGDSRKDSNRFYLEKAKVFIESARKEEKSFCLFIASHDAHAPFTTGDPSQYKAEDLTIPPYWKDTPELRETLVKYYAEISNLDALVGSVRSYLRKSGLEENTILFFCSEQGSQLPFAKWTCFDNGLHTALIACCPQTIPAGKTSDELFWMCDIAPTFLEAAGGKFKMEEFDGRSQWANLRGKKIRVHQHVFGAFSNKGIIDNRERIYPIRAVRDGRYSLIYSPNFKEITSNITLTQGLQMVQQKSQPKKDAEPDVVGSWVRAAGKKPLEDPVIKKLFYRPEYALYDLESDPHELQDISKNPEHAETFNRLKNTLHEYLSAHEDSKPIETEKAITKNQGSKKKKQKKTK